MGDLAVDTGLHLRAGMKTVAQIMSPQPCTIDPKASVADAFRKMADEGVHHLPVVHDGVLVGMVSDTDLLSMKPPPAFSEAQTRFAHQPIEAVMSEILVTLNMLEPAGEAVAMMLARNVGVVAIVDGFDELVGTVTLVDVARAYYSALTREEALPRPGGRSKVMLPAPAFAPW